MIALQTYLLSAGALFSMYLLGLQLFVLKAFCMFCTASAVLTFILFIVSFLADKMVFKKRRFDLFKTGSFYSALSVAVFGFIVLFVIYKSSDFIDIQINSKVAVKSSLGAMNYDTLDTMSGLKQLQLDSEQYKVRRNTFINYIVNHDRKSMGLDTNTYYKLFVRYDYSILNDAHRKKIKELIAVDNLNALIEGKEPVSQDKEPEKLSKLIDQLITRYEVDFLLPDQQRLKVDPNPIYVTSQGRKGAKISVVVFSDFLCSHCASFHHFLEKLMADYPRLIYAEFRHFPHLSKGSTEIAKLSVCAHAQGKFSEFASAYYDNQKDVTKDNFLEFIPESLDKQALGDCYYSPLPQHVLDFDNQLIDKLKVQATPTILINGYLGSKEVLLQEVSKYTADK